MARSHDIELQFDTDLGDEYIFSKFPVIILMDSQG